MTFIAPMQALSVDKLPEGDWLYEIKLDGYRALAFKDGKNVRLVSRNNKPLNYPQLTDFLKLLPADRVILDGEIVALDEKGRSFQLLQVYKSSEQRVPLVYYAAAAGSKERRCCGSGGQPCTARNTLSVQCVVSLTKETLHHVMCLYQYLHLIRHRVPHKVRANAL
jgi:hypothetical protein